MSLCDWSSDVCSSDLGQLVVVERLAGLERVVLDSADGDDGGRAGGRRRRAGDEGVQPAAESRSEERRVGKERGSRVAHAASTRAQETQQESERQRAMQ